MKIRNCPECYGTGTKVCRTENGVIRHIAGKCSYCHGAKKVNSDFVKWNNARDKLRVKLLNYYEEQMRKLIKLKVDVDLDDWDIKNPKPRKFPRHGGPMGKTKI